MAKISTYTTDATIDPADKLIGTDGSQGVDNGKTKNFTVANLQAYMGKGANELQKKIELSTAQLKTIGETGVVVLNAIPNNIIVPTKVAYYVKGQTATNNLNLPSVVAVRYVNSLTSSASPSTFNLQATHINNTTDPADRYYIDATRNDATLVVNSAIEIGGNSQSGNPTETGTAVTKMTVWINYQLIDVS